MVKVRTKRLNVSAIATFAANLKKYRVSKGLTQGQLANKTEIDYAEFGRIERGKVNVTISTLFDIASALEIKPHQLLED